MIPLEWMPPLMFGGLIVIMLISVVFYLWFVNRGRRTREVSVL